jgi:LL-H family phage holin
MQQIQEIVISGAMGILTILAGIVVKAVKDFLIAKGGEKSIKIVEILAKNAVNAVEQVAKETGIKGEEKLAKAKSAIVNELDKYNVYMSDKDLDVFVESAVKQMNDNWKGSK